MVLALTEKRANPWLFFAFWTFFTSAPFCLSFASFLFCCLSLFLHPKKTIFVLLFPCVSSHWWVHFPRSVLSSLLVSCSLSGRRVCHQRQFQMLLSIFTEQHQGWKQQPQRRHPRQPAQVRHRSVSCTGDFPRQWAWPPRHHTIPALALPPAICHAAGVSWEKIKTHRIFERMLILIAQCFCFCFLMLHCPLLEIWVT